MQHYSSQRKLLPLLTLLLVVTACNAPVKQDLAIENDHPKLIKTIGDPRYGHVRCGIQDKSGILWFGTTENGLYAFDGKSFRQFLEADGLSSNSINDIVEDKEDRLWIGTSEGICLYDGKTFTPIQIPSTLIGEPNTNQFHPSQIIYDIMEDRAGQLWFATIDGVFIHDGTDFKTFILPADANGFLSSNDNVEQLLEDKDGIIWLGGRTNEGVYRYDGKSVSNLPLENLVQDGPTPKPHNWGWPQLQDKNGNIWFSNWGGAYRYDGKSVTSFTKKDGLPGMVTRIIEDKKGNLWFGGDGICRYDGQAFTCYSTKDGLVHPGVWSILEDNAENLWVGTWNTGLHLFDGTTFISYSEYQHQPETGNN